MTRTVPLLIALAMSSFACTQTNTTRPSPTAGELIVTNNTDELVCHVYVAPVTQPEQQFDLIEDRGENSMKPRSNRRFLPEDTSLLQQQVPFQVTAETCDGALSSRFEFSFDRGGVFTINSF